MSRKRIQTQQDEVEAWLERRNREREEARQRALAQRRPVPGFKRQSLDEE